MIKPIGLKFENAVTYATCKVPLKDQGLVFLTGGNGTGKSTIWEILEHTVYEKTSKGLRKNAIVMSHADDGYKSEFFFDVDDTRWKVVQARKHKDLGTGMWVYRRSGKKWRDVTPKVESGRNRVQLFVEKVFGLSIDEFHGCVYLSQQTTHTLIEGTGKQCYDYLGKLFMLDVYDQLAEQAKLEAKQHAKKMQSVEQELAVLEHVRASLAVLPDPEDLESDIQDLCDRDEILGGKLEKARKSQRSQRDKQRRIEDKQRLRREAREKGVKAGTTITSVRETLEDLQTKRNALLVKRNNLVEEEVIAKERARLQVAIDASKSKLPKKWDRLTFRKEVKQWRDVIADLKVEKERSLRAEELVNALAALAKAKTKISIDHVETMRADLATLRASFTLMKQELADLKKLGKECPTCHRPYEAGDKAKQVAFLRDNLVQTSGDIKKAAAKLEDAETALETIQERKRIRTEITRLEDQGVREPAVIDNELTGAEGKLGELENKTRHATRLESFQQQLADLDETREPDVVFAEMKKLDDNVGKLEVCANRLRDHLQLLKQLVEYKAVSIKELPQVKAKLKTVAKIIMQAEDDRADYMRELGGLRVTEKQIRGLLAQKEDLEEQEKVARELKREVLVCKTLQKAFGSLKARRVHKIAKTMETLLAQFTDVMFAGHNGVSFRVDDAPDSIAIFKDVIRPDYDSSIRVPVRGLSGGEKQRLSICLLWTLHQMVSSKKRVDMLVLDEVDKGLDADGVDALISLIETKGQEIGTVIVITHRPELAKVNFDKVWHVEKKDEVSRLVVLHGTV